MFAVFCMMSGMAQEYLTGFNAGVQQDKTQKSRTEAVATLPFFDDFTNPGFYPDETKWQSRNVLVNSGFPKMPINHGAATLDVVDEFGMVYSNGSSNPFIADSLLSVRIRLDSVGNHALTPDDSLYFSFYYQPGGFGDSPDRDDSLVLMFGYNGQWKQMWSTGGEEFETFVDSLAPGEYFKKVMIPIVDSCFFVEDFYVLFFNYGSLPSTMYPNDRSNMDMWNIDFVRLDMNRSIEDDTYPQVGLTNFAPSFLKRYQVMPYRHFIDNPINEINNIFDMYLTNMDVNAHEIRYSCEVEDNNSGWHYSYSGDPFIIDQYSNYGVVRDSISMDNFIYPYNLPVDTTSFTIRHYVEIIDEHSGEVSGDSIVRRQEFTDYFAYDDGTPEMGYGVSGNGYNYFAVQFKVSQLDTLKGVRMLFNRTFNDANYNFFDIVVWKDNNGKPGQELYVLENQRPKWNDTTLYQFSEYLFDEIVKVNSVFYVGICQHYSKSINIGFDSSIDKHQYTFYEVGNGWKNSSFSGSLLLRPVMGKNPDITGNNNNGGDNKTIELYPVPTRDRVSIEGVEGSECKEIFIFDLAGRLVKKYSYTKELNVSDLESGMYMLRVVRTNGKSDTSKLMISK